MNEAGKDEARSGMVPEQSDPGQASHSHLSISAARAEKTYESSWARIAECKKQNTKQK